MKIINLNKTWDSVVAEIHRVKPRRNNLLKREALFGLQILLGQYELVKSGNNGKLINFYTDALKTYEKYSINGHIVWEK